MSFNFRYAACDFELGIRSFNVRAAPVLDKVYLKLIIQERYRRNVHYVWCSEIFDSKVVSRYSPGSLVPSSSNPADIYRELNRDVQARDRHSAKITAQRASFKALAVRWHANAEITEVQRDEILYMADNADFAEWRPLLYVIPRTSVDARLKLVPIAQRAGFGDEFIIEELRRDEFDVVEL